MTWHQGSSGKIWGGACIEFGLIFLQFSVLTVQILFRGFESVNPLIHILRTQGGEGGSRENVRTQIKKLNV